MKPGFFIDRPVFSTVLSVLIVIVGIIGLLLLPVEQYPQITPPVVKISTSYPGANALTVSQAVATPIEQELNGTPGMIYMESSSSNTGGLSLTVTFDANVDPDLAAVEIQNRVKLAESRLPAEVLQNGISIEKQSTSQLMTIALTSDDPKYDEIYLSNYATINLIDVLKRIPGVGRISNIGSRYYGMQIWVYPDRMASFGLTVKDIQDALKDQNRESAAGELGKPPVSDVDVAIPLTAQGRLSTVQEFEEIVIKANADGSFIRMRDVARVSLEASSYTTESGLNGRNAAILSVYTLPGANSMEVAREIKKEMGTIAHNFPEGMEYLIPFDMTGYISESIHEVYKTLFEALLLVVIVIFLSLQNWRASIIPIVAVPISLIGTFGFMLAMGFSLNMLTLLGLVLAIGIVVDDAIVVVENVERIMEEKRMKAREATHIAMRELTSALIATSLVLAAVFVPVSFLPGITGALYRQFSVTIAVSVLISTVVALTLSPAMCALILRPATGKKNALFCRINDWLARGNKTYTNILLRVISNPRRITAGFGMVLVLIFVLYRITPTSFIPQEDQGFFTVELEMPEGTTIERNTAVTERAVRYIDSLEDVAYVQNVTGSSPRVGTNQGRTTLTVILKSWKERSKGVDALMKEVRDKLYNYPQIKVYTSRPPVVPGLGSAGGIEMKLQAKAGATWEDLAAATDTFLLYASQAKELAGASSSLQSEIPQLYFDVDRDKAKLLGIPLSDIFSTMKAFLGSIYVNDFNLYNRIYRVYIQADQSFRATASNINLFFVKAANGTMVPLTAVGRTSYTTGPGTITRFNMYTSASIQVSPAIGYSSGQAMTAIERIAAEHLPENIGVAWSGLSYQEKESGGQTGMILGFVLLFVFLFLAAQYESWTVPVSILLSLPVAALGALLGLFVLRLENDIYFQIGLVTLIGLAAKNAILIVEFAKIQVDQGMAPTYAAIQGAKLRFRPILMTSLAFILGMFPMVIASGPGSASRHSIGTGVFFGMIVAVTVGILFVPFFFVMVYKMKDKMKDKIQFPSVKSPAWLPPLRARLTKQVLRWYRKVRQHVGLLLIAVISLSVVSCKVGQAYKTPAMELPQTFKQAGTLPENTAGTGWSTLYADTALQSLIDKALTHNKDMHIAAANMREMVAKKRISFAGMFPEVGVNASAENSYTDYGGKASANDPEIHADLALNWEIDIWGKLRWTNDAGIAAYLQSVEAQQALQLSIVAAVAQSYFELTALDQELQIVRQTLHARRQAVHFAKIRYEGGQTSEIPYRQSQVELARTETLVPNLEKSIQVKENELSLLLGEFPHSIPRGKTLDEQSMPETLPIGLPSTLLQRRPDIRQAEQRLIEANAEVGVALTSMFPSIRLTASAGGENTELTDFLKSPTWLVSGLLTGPVFNMGKNKARHKAAQAVFEQTTYAYEKTVLQSFVEVNNAIISFRKAKDIRQSQETLYSAAQAYQKLASLQYINGIVSYIDVLDAQRQLFDAEISLNDAILGELLSTVALYKALGGGLER